jgi:hypothetical protein
VCCCICRVKMKHLTSEEFRNCIKPHNPTVSINRGLNLTVPTNLEIFNSQEKIYDRVIRAEQAPKFYLWGLGAGDFNLYETLRVKRSYCRRLYAVPIPQQVLAVIPRFAASFFMLSQAVGVKKTVLLPLISS